MSFYDMNIDQISYSKDMLQVTGVYHNTKHLRFLGI